MHTSGLLSVLIPVYNEEEFVGVLLERVLRAPLPEGLESELIVVDDGSSDGSVQAIEAIAAQHPGRIRLILHQRNQGKGAAIRTAIEQARGDFGIIQDADLEYDPQEYLRLLQPLVEERCDVVYGSRFVVAGERRVLYFWHALANQLLTTLCNMFADLNLTDMETCYKAFRMSLVKSIPIRSNRFGIEPELTIKLAQRQASIIELPINYYGRTYAEGKKIGLKDAFQALAVILRYGLTRDIYTDDGAAILDALAQTPRFNRWMAETIRPHLGNRILELGAGIGNLTMHLSRRRQLYVASDIDEEHLSRLGTRFRYRPNLQIRRCDLESAAHFECIPDPIDTVVCLNVLEHVKDDALGLRNIAGILQPGGRAIILVPEGMSVYGTLDKVLGHWRRYSEQELKTKCETAGLRVETILRFNRITRPAWFVNGRIFRRTRFSRFQLAVFDRLVWLWKRFDRFIPWKPVSIIAIALKPDRTAHPL
ncbi:MAG: glycosyltransferase [Bryobacteraceae bacterium]|nr:glycosyltransferase [Bryobacteraceae bacterium]